MASFLKNMGNILLFPLNKTLILQKSFSFPFQIGINQYSKRAKIYQNLGLDAPPKKPLVAYIRFVKEYIAKNPTPGKSIAENSKTLGIKWKELNATQKQTYEDAYKRDKAIYDKQIEQFKLNITEDQLLAIKNERKRLESAKIVKKALKENRNTNASLGKPKKPPTPYILFRVELTGQTMAAIAEKWAKLPENEKSVYIKKAAPLRAKYEKDIEAWEKEMISQGNEHVVRKQTIAALKKDDIQSVPNSSTQEVRATDEINVNMMNINDNEVIANDERSLDSGKKQTEDMKSRIENTNTMNDSKTTYIISKFKKFFKS